MLSTPLEHQMVESRVLSVNIISQLTCLYLCIRLTLVKMLSSILPYLQKLIVLLLDLTSTMSIFPVTLTLFLMALPR